MDIKLLILPAALLLVSCGGGGGSDELQSDFTPIVETPTTPDQPEVMEPDPDVDSEPTAEPSPEPIPGATEPVAPESTPEPTPDPIAVLPSADPVFRECLDESGTDGFSINNEWNDNCTVRRFGDFAASLYTVGIQRIVFCTGFVTLGTGELDTFAGGDLGPLSERFIQDYQRDRGLVDDGVVNAATWASLQSELTLLGEGVLGAESQAMDSYGFTDGVCANRVLFYQDINLSNSGPDFVRGGWSLARNPPESDQIERFSIELPF